MTSGAPFVVTILVCAAFLVAAPPEAQPATRPNIVWIVAEDMSPDLGCYGDAYARTPNLDRFAAQGARFTRAFTQAPVCAPSRSGLITGIYPTTIGSHHMRSKLLDPPPTFTEHLRSAGYFVAWPGKTDFNFKLDPPDGAFDSRRDWVREPDALPRDRPFFAYLNLGTSHESQVRSTDRRFAENTASLTPDQRHDPAAATLPAYYPDTPEVRRDWARYYDLVTAVDHQVGRILRTLDERGLSDNTIVFFFGDHGRGLPRGKRWAYDSGIRVPLLVRWPGRVAAGAVRDDLVSFVDFAPTVLTLAGAAVPPRLQGQPFLNDRGERPDNVPERRYVFAARDRMDETYDRIRAVRDHRFKYVRNFHPELPYAQHIAYMDEMPTMQAWRRLHDQGKLTGPPALFFAAAKPPEELYDLDADPHEIANLAAVPEHAGKLKELREALERWIEGTKDLGAVPERELIRRGLVADVLADYERRSHPAAK